MLQYGNMLQTDVSEVWFLKITCHIQLSVFSGIKTPVLVSPFLSLFPHLLSFSTQQRRWKEAEKLGRETKWKVDPLAICYPVLLLFHFIMFTAGKDKNNFTLMKISLSLVSVVFFLIVYWSTADLQCCIDFWCRAKWYSHPYT